MFFLVFLSFVGLVGSTNFPAGSGASAATKCQLKEVHCLDVYKFEAIYVELFNQGKFEELVEEGYTKKAKYLSSLLGNYLGDKRIARAYREDFAPHKPSNLTISWENLINSGCFHQAYGSFTMQLDGKPTSGVIYHEFNVDDLQLRIDQLDFYQN